MSLSLCVIVPIWSSSQSFLVTSVMLRYDWPIFDRFQVNKLFFNRLNLIIVWHNKMTLLFALLQQVTVARKANKNKHERTATSDSVQHK